MIKAVFLDYTGTVLQRRGLDMETIVNNAVKESTLRSQEELMDFWHKEMRKLKNNCTHETYEACDSLVLRLLDTAKMQVRFKGDPVQALDQVRNYWMYGPVYGDAMEFLDICTVPVYILSEYSREYVSICLKRNRLHINEIISSDDVKAYAPHPEYYEAGLKKADCIADEAVLVSEDYEDVLKGAEEAGMHAVLLDRKSGHRDYEGKRIRSLIELLPLIQTENDKSGK